jgi:hypothetical protein
LIVLDWKILLLLLLKTKPTKSLSVVEHLVACDVFLEHRSTVLNVVYDIIVIIREVALSRNVIENRIDFSRSRKLTRHIQIRLR